MLAVVKNKEQVPALYVVGQRAHHPSGGYVPEAQGARYRLSEEGGVTKVGELGHPHPIGECPPHLGRRTESEPSLTNPRRTDQREKRREGQGLLSLTELSPPSHEGREFALKDCGARHNVASVGTDARTVKADPYAIPGPMSCLIGEPGWVDGGYTGWQIGSGGISIGPHSEVHGKYTADGLNPAPGRTVHAFASQRFRRPIT